MSRCEGDYVLSSMGVCNILYTFLIVYVCLLCVSMFRAGMCLCT